jgi:TRAP-type mannitol/chloroaromatic compound transport system permease large subunit
MGAMGALLISVGRRKINFAVVFDCLSETAETTAIAVEMGVNPIWIGIFVVMVIEMAC